MTRRFPAARLPAVGEQVELDGDTSHHLLRVSLTPRGREVILFNGQGQECEGRLVGVSGARAVVEAVAPVRPSLPLHPLVLLIGLPRKPAWELILRMGTELGVTTFIPFPAARSVALGLHPDRWIRMVVAAAGQCGRGDLPSLVPADSLSQALAAVPSGLERQVMVPGVVSRAPSKSGTALLIGPEGGLTSAEIEAAIQEKFIPAGLGSWTLRTDTAVIAALSVAALSTQ